MSFYKKHQTWAVHASVTQTVKTVMVVNTMSFFIRVTKDENPDYEMNYKLQMSETFYKSDILSSRTV